MSESTRQRILQAAIELAREKGLGALSVRSAAAAAGVGPTTLRNYFPTQALLHSAVTAEFVSVSMSDRNIADSSLPAAQRLAECLEQFLPSKRDPMAALEGWMEYYRLSFGPDAAHGVRDVLVNGRRSSANAIERWLLLLREEGHSLPAVVTEQATMLLALIDGLHLAMLTEPERLDVPAAQQLLRTFIATSVLVETDAPTGRSGRARSRGSA
ncbi:TetR/AcrR family transcriptional regulator [Microlunatus speluncae]|uniref:TetR/AcrR family transcriptional regulator n=1 Tax=Microlunatus speluncae TaxID=2594267 RepID=UPI0012663C6E|nr:TetR/AcrR family transcriptional regulator [Microlunatus speluncae]